MASPEESHRQRAQRYASATPPLGYALPSALRGFSVLFMGQNLFCKLDITFGAFGAGIVGQDRFAEARGFGEADAPGNDGVKNLVFEELDRKSVV